MVEIVTSDPYNNSSIVGKLHSITVSWKNISNNICGRSVITQPEQQRAPRQKHKEEELQNKSRQ